MDGVFLTILAPEEVVLTAESQPGDTGQLSAGHAPGDGTLERIVRLCLGVDAQPFCLRLIMLTQSSSRRTGNVSWQRVQLLKHRRQQRQRSATTLVERIWTE